MSGTSLTRFLGAVRRRLWLETVLHRLRAAVWTTGAVLLLFAAAHTLWQPVALSAAITIALLAGLVALSPAVFSRPSLQQCALRVDRQFEGRQLVTTANELDRAMQLRPAEETVVQRALEAAEMWRTRLGELWQAPPRSGYVLAVIPIFFAVLLLQFPAAGDVAAIRADENGRAAQDLPPGASSLDSSDNLAAVREAIVQGAKEIVLGEADVQADVELCDPELARRQRLD